MSDFVRDTGILLLSSFFRFHQVSYIAIQLGHCEAVACPLDLQGLRLASGCLTRPYAESTRVPIARPLGAGSEGPFDGPPRELAPQARDEHGHECYFASC